MLLVDRGGSLFPSDARFADTQGDDGVPEIAVGRVPALSAAELTDYLRKLEAYERGDGALARTRSCCSPTAPTPTSTSPPKAGNSPGSCPRASPARCWRWPSSRASPPPAASSSAPWAPAAPGSPTWATAGSTGSPRQGLLTKSDVPGLGNQGKLFVLQTVSCHVGLHGLPGFDSLGEDLVIDPAAGAVAVFAPAWLSEHDEAKLLADRLLRQVFQLKAPRLGDAIREAAASAAAERGAGHPARRLPAARRPGAPAAPRAAGGRTAARLRARLQARAEQEKNRKTHGGGRIWARAEA